MKFALKGGRLPSCQCSWRNDQGRQNSTCYQIMVRLTMENVIKINELANRGPNKKTPYFTGSNPPLSRRGRPHKESAFPRFYLLALWEPPPRPIYEKYGSSGNVFFFQFERRSSCPRTGCLNMIWAQTHWSLKLLAVNRGAYNAIVDGIMWKCF